MNLWYASLEKPAYTPPGWLFGPAWALLYVTMLVACVLFIKNDTGRHRLVGLGLFGLNIVANLAWSPLFFGAQRIGLALADCLLIATTAWATVLYFRQAVPAGAYILVPYALWVTFATVLNAHIYILNR